MKNLKYIFSIIFAFASANMANANDDKQIAFYKRGIVNIKTTSSIKPYGAIDTNNEGIGCIVDKQNGIILTSKLRVDPLAINTYEITLQNGNQTMAKLFYYDPWLDFAFLKVDPTSLPKDSIEFEFCEKPMKQNEKVLVIGGSKNKQICIVPGTAINLFAISGSMPQHTILINVENKAFFSGAPMFDTNHKLVSIIVDHNDSLANALHMSYIKHAFDSIKNGQNPTRKHVGAICTIYSLNDAMKFRKFANDKIVTDYKKQYPNCATTIIQVDHVLQGSPAQGKLIAGDIIWEVNGTSVGPNLSTLDMAMNTSTKDSINLKIFRNGQWLNLDVKLYNLEDHTIKRLVVFGNTIFFEADDTFSDKTGIPAGKTIFFKSVSNTTFSKVLHYTDNNTFYFGVDLIAINNVKVQTIDQLISLIPSLIKKKKFTLDYVNLLAFTDGLSELFNHNFSQANILTADILYDINSTEPRLFTFDKKEMEWISNIIKG